jgi:drug/metabolite transporter (DMT)-like permease
MAGHAAAAERCCGLGQTIEACKVRPTLEAPISFGKRWVYGLLESVRLAASLSRHHLIASLMLLRVAPLIFVLIWSGAFVAARGGLPDFSPWAILTLRFIAAAIILLVLALFIREENPDWTSFRRRWAGVVGAGIFMNGLYLGLFFTAMQEISAATTALIGSLTPLLTAVLSGPLLGERFRWLQWAGFLLGIIGVAIVVGFDYVNLGVGIGGGIAAAFAGVLSMTFGTLWHARVARGLPLLATNATQMAASAVVCFVIMTLVETPRIEWTQPAMLAFGYLTVGVSLGGMGLYLLMLRHGAAGKVAANFYLTPGTAAVLAFLILGETLRIEALVGLALATAGVWLVQRGGVKPG